MSFIPSIEIVTKGLTILQRRLVRFVISTYRTSRAGSIQMTLPMFPGAGNTGPCPRSLFQRRRHLLWPGRQSCPAPAAAAPPPPPPPNASKRPVPRGAVRASPPRSGRGGYGSAVAHRLPLPAFVRHSRRGHHQQPFGLGQFELRRAGRDLGFGALPRCGLGGHSHGRRVRPVSRGGGGRAPLLSFVTGCLQKQQPQEQP